MNAKIKCKAPTHTKWKKLQINLFAYKHKSRRAESELKASSPLNVDWIPSARRKLSSIPTYLVTCITVIPFRSFAVPLRASSIVNSFNLSISHATKIQRKIILGADGDQFIWRASARLLKRDFISASAPPLSSIGRAHPLAWRTVGAG